MPIPKFRPKVLLCLILLLCMQLDLFRWLRTPLDEFVSGVSWQNQDRPIVRILWLYWDQGLEQLESLAETSDSKYSSDFYCVKAWHILNPDWDVRILNRTQAMRLSPKFAAILAKDKSQRFHSSKTANILRLELLTQFGGVWSDTSNCPFRPLNDFVPLMLASSTGGFFMPFLKGKNFAGDLSGSALEQWSDCHKIDGMASEARSGNTWFLVAAQPHNVVFETWLNALFERMMWIIATDAPFPYYLAQCTFTQVRIHHPAVEEAWQVFARQPHYWSLGIAKSGMCYRGEVCDNLSCRLTRAFSKLAKHRCFFVKKQTERILEYVKSPEYMDFVEKLVQ